MSCWCWGKKGQHALDVILACSYSAGYVVGKEKGALGVRSKRLTGRGWHQEKKRQVVDLLLVMCGINSGWGGDWRWGARRSLSTRGPQRGRGLDGLVGRRALAVASRWVAARSAQQRWWIHQRKEMKLQLEAITELCDYWTLHIFHGKLTDCGKFSWKCLILSILIHGWNVR